MGLFSSIKAIFQFRKELRRSIEEAKENEMRYLEMTTDELSALSDDELFTAPSRIRSRRTSPPGPR